MIFLMHWITKHLIWLSEDDCKHIKNDDITRFDVVAENIAIESVKENFFNVCPDGQYAMGVNTPHGGTSEDVIKVAGRCFDECI